MPREPIPTFYFALAVVRLGHRFLLVHERKHGQQWYLPAGRVEHGETLVEAARRETLEETGVPIVIEGVLRVEHTLRESSARVRVIFLARPADDTPPKSVADKESLEARWVSLEDLKHLELRGPEVREIFEHVAAGGAVHPLHVLAAEGDPMPRHRR